MAYRAFDDWSRAAISYLPRPARVEAPAFTSLEMQAIALAKADGAWSIRPKDRFVRLVERIFGFRQANKLANPRLEALRRFAVVSRLSRGRPADAEIARFLNAGFTPRHATLLQRTAA